MLRSNSKSPGNHVFSPEEEKERMQWEGFAEKKEFTYYSTEPGKVCGIRRCCSRANDITRREHYLWLQSGINLVTAESA